MLFRFDFNQFLFFSARTTLTMGTEMVVLEVGVVGDGGGETNSKEELQRKSRLECPSPRLYVRPRLNTYTIWKTPGVLEVTRSMLDSDHGEEALLESYTRNLHAIGPTIIFILIMTVMTWHWAGSLPENDNHDKDENDSNDYIIMAKMMVMTIFKQRRCRCRFQNGADKQTSKPKLE